MSSFIECLQVFYKFGFRAHHSTSSSLNHLVYKITSANDQRQISAGVSLDLSKAFDTLDHEILFYKLQHYDVRGLTLQ